MQIQKDIIIVDTIESEDNIEDMEDKMKQTDIDIMRLALGSEELLKYSTRTFQQNNSISSPGNREKFNNSAIELDQNASQSQDGQTLFTRHPFKEFTQQNFKKILQQENSQKILKMREKSLKFRHQAELKMLKM